MGMISSRLKNSNRSNRCCKNQLKDGCPEESATRTHIVTLGGNNIFTIYSAKALLYIYGGSGNDTVILKAFIEILADGKLAAYENDKIFLDGGSGENQLTVIKSGLFDVIRAKDGTIKGSGFDVDYANFSDVTVSKFQPAEDNTDSITTRQLIVYSLMQLAQSGILYVIIAFILVCAASVVYLRKRKKRTKERKETIAVSGS